MEDAIKELDAAVTRDGYASQLKEAYPNASRQSIKNAEQLHALKTQIEQLKTRLEQREKHQMTETEQAAADVALRVAMMTTQMGVATEEEKQLVKAATTSSDTHSDSMGDLFDPHDGTHI